MTYEKEGLSNIPIRVRFPGLSMHYWGENCLKLIASILGRVIRIDNATLNKDRMAFARVLMNINIKNGFHDSIAFTNEDDELISTKVVYDWKPLICSKCKQLGHAEDVCRVGVVRR